MNQHELKTDPIPFEAAIQGNKPFELRLNDRDYQVGDIVILNETQFSCEEMAEGSPLVFTGRSLKRIITDVREGYGLKDGYCVLGLKPAAALTEEMVEKFEVEHERQCFACHAELLDYPEECPDCFGEKEYKEIVDIPFGRCVEIYTKLTELYWKL